MFNVAAHALLKKFSMASSLVERSTIFYERQICENSDQLELLYTRIYV